MAVPVSVVVVSRDRPAALRRCLAALDQLFHPAFEVIVVADPAGVDVARAAGFARVVAFDEPNISAARNAGVAVAGGDVVAFIDDDAVAEPTWLDHLVAPFADASVAVAGGFVIGRNGISFQWRARAVDAAGVARDLPLWGDGARVFEPPAHGAIKTEGTNMAVRADVLRALGGFDPAFAFYLDETDLNMRLAAAGHRCALVPLAQVHHGFAASSRRRADRVPLDLFDIGASSAAFWSRHLDPADHAGARAALIAEQKARAVRHLIAGTAEPRDLRRLMASLRAGLEDGAIRPAFRAADWPDARPFAPVTTPRPTGSAIVTDRAAAIALRAGGQVATLLTLTRDARRHRGGFGDDGIWWQTGGIWGRSVRDVPPVRAVRRRRRVAEESARLAAVRGLSASMEQ